MGSSALNPDHSEEVKSFPALRAEMVKHNIAARGVRDELVLEAMGKVPRELFLPAKLREFANEDSPLPIAGEQTISQPYIVAFMAEALMLEGGEKVLEIGAGSGYAAAVLSEIAADVYTVERLGPLAEKAAVTLAELGYDNVHVLHGDGTKGWPEHAPYDAIVVAAGGPQVPKALKEQLKIGGRLMIPVGADQHSQELVRVIRVSKDEYRNEDIADVRFVPLIGEEGWATAKGETAPVRRALRPVAPDEEALVRNLADAAESFPSIEAADLGPLMERIGSARVVLLGEATHGTSEFYRMRERITRDLIVKKGFRFVAIEADWPDAARVDHYVRHFEYPPSEWTAFARFPTWMWRNTEVRDFVSWLRKHNGTVDKSKRVAFHGLDLYSLYDSIRSVLNYLDEVDPASARVARERYGCLTPWQRDPATYGHAALTGSYPTCESDVARALTDLLAKRRTYAEHDGERFLDAEQNARLVANAERYYRIMYYGSRASWNLRDSHMFDTLKNLLAFHWPDATEMAARGEHNIGQLCRKEFGAQAYLVGFGTHSGTVAAASDWGGPMEVKTVRPSLPNSYEQLCHAVGLPRFMLGLRGRSELCGPKGLGKEQLERAIGVIYRPETELASHYFQASLPQQFDEYIWFDDTRAVTPLDTAEIAGLPDTYPFGV
ncbi:protein-L-isoaspartate(D-aspartate) O-methyltransferase [Bradyrhizobium japonicum]|uniref:protein-L-isoaspartate(D-aspartate) O-methyltransferase n=1 Tax=Bradyrhizobium TaxID=374 RepID=UPI0004B5D66D|nr:MULTISPECIES: protein-L-isoaspartate(D-aspartate) O-methyltransferase [Bradyrhizobium]MDI2074735.1 protein-L-isoaspartate(D-aspartate) O-methyltransferase [Bradyrhizobium sp. Mp27]